MVERKKEEVEGKGNEKKKKKGDGGGKMEGYEREGRWWKVKG